jgi:hypothetical protein
MAKNHAFAKAFIYDNITHPMMVLENGNHEGEVKMRKYLDD